MTAKKVMPKKDGLPKVRLPTDIQRLKGQWYNGIQDTAKATTKKMNKKIKDKNKITHKTANMSNLMYKLYFYV